jgi:hypothetical protein
MSSSSSDHDAAREAGRRDAEAFEASLRQLEGDEREQRLAVLAWQPSTTASRTMAAEDSLRVVQLEARVSELTAYVRAVNNSVPWRLVQWFRRLLGRAW